MSTSPSHRSRRGRRRVEPWPLAVAGLLLAMIASALAFWAVAAAHPVTLVAEDPFQAGLAYNDRVAERRRAEALGLVLALDTAPAEGGVAVRVRVTRDGGPAGAVERVVVRRERPTEGGLDAAFPLEAGPDGVFRGRVPVPRPGRWRLVATATVEGVELRRAFALGGS